MVNVSKQPLKKDLSGKLFRQLAVLLAHSKDASDATQFLRSLLSEKEEVMLAKRLAAILLLSEGRFKQNQIARMLSMSPTTVGAIEERYRHKEYDAIIKMVSRGKKEM